MRESFARCQCGKGTGRAMLRPVRKLTSRGSSAPFPGAAWIGSYLTGTIRCSYGVPDHITYGAAASGSAVAG